ncbi:capsular biosynthesis protein [Natrinema hispanicum]|uniref:capsular biosynthesis protein n=1 Tax=Natrinema hispanicum TaxID=392421 RepID=UPI00122CE63C|nr:capsular biosynthesis protein [Natrinema hispanicum]
MTTTKVGLVCEAGGPFKQLQILESGLEDFDRFYITYQTESTEGISDYLLNKKYQKVAGSVFERSLNIEKILAPFYFASVFIHLLYIFICERPDAIISTGDLTIAGPCFCIAKALGIRTIFIESVGQFEGPSTAGRVLAPISDRVLVQNRETLNEHTEKAEYHGGIF